MGTQKNTSILGRFLRHAAVISVVVFVCTGVVPRYLNTAMPQKAAAVSLTTGDGILLYGASGNTNPRFRTYTETSSSFSAAGSSVSGTVPANMVVRTAPKKQEAIAGYINTAGSLQIMCYNGSSWSNEWTVSVGGTGATRRFDIAYESSSGDVMVLYSTDTATTNELAYRTKSGGAGCGLANWSAATNFDPARTSGIVHWVQLAWDRRSSSDLITAIWADASSDLSAAVWSGSGITNEPTAALATSLDIVSAAQDIKSFDIEYESTSGDVMVVWGVSVGNNTNGVRYATCIGGVSTCTWSGVLTPPTFNDDAVSIDIAANLVSDEIVFASVGKDQSDLQAGYWSGSAWTNKANLDNSAISPGAGYQSVATGWVTLGGVSRSVIVYIDNTNTSTSLSYYTGNLGSFTAGTDFVMSPVPGAFRAFDIQTDPFHTDRLSLTFSDANNDLFTKKLVMTTGPIFTWSNTNGAAALESSLAQSAPPAFSFAYWRYAPRFEQSAYRWYENNNAANIGIVTTNPSSGSDGAQSAQADSQYVYSVGYDNGPGNSQWRIEKRLVTSYDLETGFGTSGVTTNNPSSGSDRAYAVAIDNTYMYVGGSDASLGNDRWRIEKRAKSSGLTDFSFGSLGIVTSNPSIGSDTVNAIAVDSQYVYAVGTDATGSDVRWRIEKRNKSDGSLVAGFGTAGALSSNPSGSDDAPYAVAVSGSYIYIAGYDSSPGNKQLRIEKRSTASGLLDSGFGVGGSITINAGTGDDVWRAVVVDGSSMYMAGYDSANGASNTQWRIEKRNTSNGILDGSFGGGIVLSNPTTSLDVISGIYLTGSDIYMGGMQTVAGADTQWRIEKRSAVTGSLDGAFGTSGAITTNPGSGPDNINSITVLSGSVLSAGVATSSGNDEWRYEKRSSISGTLAKALSVQDTFATLSQINQQFRLRLLLTVTQNNFLADQNFKLQFAQKSGSCDTAFSGETYVDVTSTSAIAYYNNVSPADGDVVSSSTLDPTTGNTVRYQTYEENNDFTNSQSAINVNEDGLWDFTLYDKSALVNTSYCFRVVKNDDLLLDSYTQIPEITTAPGSLTIDIVDSVASSVANPVIVLTDILVSKIFQTANGVLGASDQKIRVKNTTNNPQWQISIASSGGATSLWTADTASFDYNDPTANAGDGADADTHGGKMSLDPSGASVSAQSGCTNTGLSLGASSAFSEGIVNAITLLTAGASSALNCYWDMTGVSVSQTVPPFQPSGVYSRPMTITITAL